MESKRSLEKNKITARAKGNRALLIFVSVFLGVTLLFGIIFGIIIGIGSMGAVAEYQGVTVDKGTASYFASYYKYVYVASLRDNGIDAYDTERFWAQAAENGKSYGENLAAGAKSFISEILVANYLYNRYATLDSSARDKIKTAVNEVIDYRFGSEDAFREAAEKCGFDRASLEKAAEMLYKAAYAKMKIYGSSGVKLSSGGYPDGCAEYLGEYSRVKLLFIRTENTFKLDENGERIRDGNEYEMRALTEEEKAERLALIARIDSEIEGYENGGSIRISEELFDSYLDSYGEGEEDKNDSGYYFCSRSVYTEAFAEDVSRDIVNAALEMKLKEYKKVETDFAVCYIYRCEVEEGAYLDSSEDGFFADFYSDAADYLFSKQLTELSAGVSFSEELTYEALTSPQYNSDLYVRF